MRRLTPVLLLALAGCPNPEEQPPPSGTSVGNPGKGVSRLAPIEGLTVLDGAATTLGWHAIWCDGGVVPVGDEALVEDLLEPAAEREWPGGSWCALAVDLPETVEITGSIGEIEATEVEVSLRVQTSITLWPASTIEVDEHAYVLELGAPGWLDFGEIQFEEGFPLIIDDVGEASERHDAIVLDLLAGTALYLDDDGDGELSPAERSAGPVADTLSNPPPSWEPPPADTGDPAQTDDDGRLSSEGCNCASPGPATAGWTLLALLPLWGRRRREASRAALSRAAPTSIRAPRGTGA